MSVEQIILSNLVLNDEYCRKTLPFLKDEYFLDESERVVFKTIKNFVEEFNALPTQDALKIALDKDKNLNESVHQTCVRIINNLGDGEPKNSGLKNLSAVPQPSKLWSGESVVVSDNGRAGDSSLRPRPVFT